MGHICFLDVKLNAVQTKLKYEKPESWLVLMTTALSSSTLQIHAHAENVFIAPDPGVKSDIWDWEIHYTGLHSLKVIFHWRSVCTRLWSRTVQISVHENVEERHLSMV